MKIQTGTILNNRYEITAQIGEGGFATVFRAFDLLLNREIAIKVLKTSSHGDELRGLLREAKLLAKLSHKNIVSVYAVDAIDDSTHFITMEYLKGRTLASLIAEHSGLDYQLTVSVISQVCEALSYAHNEGLVHRDLSPANIFVVRNEQDTCIKLLDFGLSRLYSSSVEQGLSRTATGILVGNPNYMSPEQARGEKVDGRADIYSLGAVIYECISGKLPFNADTPIGLIYSQINNYPVEPKCKWLDHDDELLKFIVLTCMQKAPEKRFQNCQEILDLLCTESPPSIKNRNLDSWLSEAPKQQYSRLAPITLSLLVLACVILCVRLILTASMRNSSQRQIAAAAKVLLLDKQKKEFKQELLCKQALERAEKAYGADSPEVLNSLNDLVVLYRRQKKWAQAEHLQNRQELLYKQALDRAEKAYGTDRPELVNSLNDLVVLYQREKKWEQAEHLQNRRVKILEKLLGTNSVDVAVATHFLADLYFQHGRYSEAELLSKRAFAILDTLPDQQVDDYRAGYLDLQASCCMQQRKYAEAVPLLKRELAIEEKTLQTNPGIVAVSSNQLAECYRYQHKYADAESFYKRALIIREQMTIQDKEPLADSLSGLAACYLDQNKNTEAETLIKRTIAIREKTNQGNLADSLNMLADCYKHQGKTAEAEQIRKRVQVR